MTAIAPDHDAAAFARRLRIQVIWPTSVVALALISSPCVIAKLAPIVAADDLRCIASAVAIAAGITTLAISALLWFDVLLFQLMASHADDRVAGSVVDDLLYRMHLKPLPDRPRTLAQRISGTRGLIVRQRLAFAAFVVLSGLAVLDLRF